MDSSWIALWIAALSLRYPRRQHDRTDDLQVALDTLTADKYSELWAVVAPKSFGAAVAVPAASASGDEAQDNDAEDESGA